MRDAKLCTPQSMQTPLQMLRWERARMRLYELRCGTGLAEHLYGCNNEPKGAIEVLSRGAEGELEP